MADVQSNIHVNIDTSDALASLKLLQRQISAFHTQMSKSGAAASAVAANQAQNLMNSINATGQFQASMRTVKTSTEAFTSALEKNKLTSREYFRYTGAATKTFGRLFKTEFETINKVARERVKDIQTQYIKMGRGANGALQAIAVRPLTLDMKNLATQTAIAAQRQQLLNQLLKQGSTNLLNFGKNTQWAGRQLMVGFTVPLMLLGSTAAKTFMKLEEQAIRFKRVYGEMFTTKEETDAMVKDIQLLAKEYTRYGVAVEKTMEMAANAAAMGKMGSELKAQVMEATRLAVLGGVEQEQALETTISVTNAFGVAAEDLAKKIDFLNAVENQTVVSIEDLTIAIPKAGPVVQQLGGDVEDLAFFLTAMKEGGINASEGANALKSGLASLINPSEKASKMLAGLGINIKGIVEANKGDVKSTVVEFAAALDTLDPLNRARAIEQLFGKFQFSRLSTLFQNVGKEGTQAARVLELTKATTEELAILSERELSRIEDSTTYKFKKTIEDLKVTLAPVGEQFLKALTPIVEFVSKVLEKFNGLGDGSKKFITMITIALGAIGPVALMTFGLLANGVANIIKLFANMKMAFNRTGSSTQILGNQTDYLTQQQLEASAVAASLDQVHQRLTQRFTSETAAVNALALAYRNAIAAQVGFTGPVRGGAMKGQPQSKKYSTGVTSVPGAGNQDTVPAMLTPGEAVIPAGAAQDPANKPLIARMIAGEKIPGFNKGTTKVTYNGKDYNAQSAVGAKNIRDFLNQLVQNPDGTLTDTKTGKTFTKERLTQVLDTRELEGKFSETKIRRSLTRDNMSNRSPLIKRLTEAFNEKNAKVLAAERETIEKALRDRGLPALTASQADDAFNTKKVHLTKDVVDGVKRWRVVNVAPDAGYINQYMNTVEGNIGKDLLKMSDDDLKKLGIDRDHLKSFVDGNHPRDGKQLDTFRNIAKYDIALDEKRKVKKANIYQAHLVDAGLEYRAKEGIGGYSQGGLKSFADLNPNDKKVILERVAEADARDRFSQAHQEKLKKTAELAAQTNSGKLSPTNFGKLIAPTTGFSFDVPGVGGLYDGPNGKVFVKPMMSELDALAEKRATDFAREVHGLDTPEQKISTMIDPSDPEGKRKIIVLESKYDARFDETKMPKTFSREQYFRQLVAANLRGDKDLKMGNLGGNILTDVGTAGVFDKATSVTKDGIRTLSKNMPSMYEMAEKNLQGVPGAQAKNSPNWFANETQKKINSPSYTADDYDRDMKKEIKRIQANTEAFVSKIPLDDPLRPAYLDILRRVNEGAEVRDWKPLFHKHRSIAIRPNEVKVEKDGKAKKPKSERRPPNVKTSNSGDSRLTSKDNESQMRKTTTVRGKADAETILHPSLQRKLDREAAAAEEKARKAAENRPRAEADSIRRYGTIAPTPTQRSQRKNNENLAKQGKPLLKLTKEMSAPVSVFSKAMQKATQRVEKNTVASKVLEKFNAKRDARAAAKAEKAAAGAPKPGMGMGGAAMGVAGIAMVGSMIPGSVGEMFQKLMMPLMGLAMILPMLSSRMGALAVGVGAITAAYIYQRMQFDKAQDAAMRLTEAMGSGSESIRNLSKFANTVSAGEIMDRKRKEAFSPFQIKTGKTTFGESFMAGEDGKAMAKNVGETIKSSGSKQVAQDQVFNQMATAVASGALSPAQARSIVGNLAQELGDYSFGISVNAKLIEFLGPNGENILKDPIGVRVKILQDTREKMNLSTEAAKKAGGFTGTDKLKTGGFTIGGAAAGAGTGLVAAGLGAAGAAAMGATIGSAVPVVGTIIGAALGAGVGYFLSKKDRNKRIGEASGASVAMQKMALEQQQEMMDSVELQYIKEMEIAKAKGDQNKIDELTTKYSEDRVRLLEENAALVKDIQKSFSESEGATRKALMTGVDKAITKRYKGTNLEDVVPLATSEINDSKISEEKKYTLKMEMASGQIDPMQMIEIFNKFGEDAESMEAVATIITKFGGKFANEAMGIVSMFKDPKQSAEFVARLSLQDPDKAAKDLELFQKISQSGQVIDLDVALNYYNTNEDAREALKTDLAKIEALKGKVDLKIAAKVLGKEEMEALRKNSDHFLGLDDFQQKVYMQNLRVMFGMEGDPAMQEQYKNWLAMDGNKGKTFDDFVNAKSTQLTEVVKSDSKAVVSGNTPGNKKGPDASPLDELLKKLRDVRKGSIKVTKGFEASFKSLNKIFGGKKTIEVFSGIENQMRELGAGEDLIELIAGMDPEEFEKQKNKLFKIENGKIVALKDGVKSIGDALQSVALGDFVSTQDKMVKNIGNQNAALQRLQAAGVEGSLALEMVADASVAAAIANDKLSDKQLKKVIKSAKELTKVQKQKAAIDAAIEKNTELQTDVQNFEKILALRNQFSLEQLELILGSTELINLIAQGLNNPKIKAEFDKVLKNLEAKIKVEFEIKQLTIEGMQEIFDTGFSNAMEAFDVKEQALRIDFEIDNKALMDEIDKAEREIALYQEKIRKEEVGLKQIEDQEEKVNEKYDERLDALDQIEKANDSISQQQKGQLTLAEALTSGDIAAAARAAQEMRAQQAADNITKQKDALEQSRDYELSQLRSKDGRSRIEIENEIKRLQNEIYKIETESLLPNRETLRLNELLLEDTIKGLDVLGYTKTAWEQIKNLVDQAKIASAQFVQAMKDALGIVPKLISAYQTQKPITTSVTCSGGKVLNAQGVCVDPKADPVTCKANEVMGPDGKCIPKPGECGPNQIKNAMGICVDKPVEVTCGPNQIKNAMGICEDKPSLYPCSGGQIRNINGVCVDKPVECGSGQILNSQGICVDKPKEEDPIVPAAVTTVIPETKPQLETYTVKPGDTLSEIAADNGISLAELYALNPKFKTNPKYQGGNMIWSGTTVKLPGDDETVGGGGGGGGFFQVKAKGGLINPMKFALGGFAKGTDTVPAMLTPGEFIMSKYAVDAHGIDTMKAINNGKSVGGSVYNNTYTLTVNAKTDANPNDIAQAVMATIKQVDDRRVRGVAISGRR